MKSMRKGALGVLVFVMAIGCVVPVDVDIDHDDDRIQGSGRLISESRVVRDFDGISVSGVAKVIIEQTDAESLEITAEDNLMAYIRSEVRDGILIIGPRPGVDLEQTEEITYRIWTKDLAEIQISGVVHVWASNVDTPYLFVRQSGVTEVDIWGRAGRLDLTASGATSFRGLELETLETMATASGVASLMVNVRDHLSVQASGASVVRYAGNPSVEVSVSGAASVRGY